MNMKLTTYEKGATYFADCAKCGATMASHEWYHGDNNERRDAMQNGTLQCDVCCSGKANPDTFHDAGRMYACHYTMPGYLDQTEPMYGKNRRKLEKEVRDFHNGF